MADCKLTEADKERVKAKQADTKGKLELYASLPFVTMPKVEVEEKMFGRVDGHRDWDITRYEIRSQFVKKFSWSIPCKEVIDAFKKYSPSRKILDVMAGSGWWVKLLNDVGLNAEASDIEPGEGNSYKHHTSWVPIKKCDGAEMVKLNQEADIIVAWPPYDEPEGTRIVKEIKRPGTILYYIGEGPDGCTGDGEFHNLLDDKNEWESLEFVSLPQWDGLHDNMEVFKKK